MEGGRLAVGFRIWLGRESENESVPYVFVFGRLDAGFLEHLDTVCESYPRGAALGDLEVACVRVFALDDAHMVFTTLAEAVEYKD